MQISCLDYLSALKMEATGPSETSVEFQVTICCYIQDDKTLHTDFIPQ
jgi:hypothetical protein